MMRNGTQVLLSSPDPLPSLRGFNGAALARLHCISHSSRESGELQAVMAGRLLCRDVNELVGVWGSSPALARSVWPFEDFGTGFSKGSLLTFKYTFENKICTIIKQLSFFFDTF